MNQILIGLGIGLVFFYATIHAYILGHKHANSIAKGKLPPINVNPVKKAVKVFGDIVDKKKQQALAEELDDIMSVTRESMLRHIESEVTR